MHAFTILCTVVFVAVCGQLVSSSPVVGDIIQPGPKTYTINELDKNIKVEVRRVPANKAHLFSEYSEQETSSDNSVTFGQLTPRSSLGF